MSEQAQKVPKWVHYVIDYGGLAAWLATLVITRNAVTSSWVIVGASILALAIGLVVERRLAPMPLVTAVLGPTPIIPIRNIRSIKRESPVDSSLSGLISLNRTIDR